MVTFELWDMNSRNLVGTFDTEEAALESVRDAIERHGRNYVNTLALGREDSRGRSKMIAAGTALAERATDKEGVGLPAKGDANGRQSCLEPGDPLGSEAPPRASRAR